MFRLGLVSFQAAMGDAQTVDILVDERQRRRSDGGHRRIDRNRGPLAGEGQEKIDRRQAGAVRPAHRSLVFVVLRVVVLNPQARGSLDFALAKSAIRSASLYVGPRSLSHSELRVGDGAVRAPDAASFSLNFDASRPLSAKTSTQSAATAGSPRAASTRVSAPPLDALGVLM